MAGFVAILVLSTLLYGGGVSLLVCLGLVASMVAFVYVRAVITPKNVEFFIQTAMWGTIANVIIAIVQALTYDTAGGYRPTALFYNPNYYAMISGFVLGAGAVSMAARRRQQAVDCRFGGGGRNGPGPVKTRAPVLLSAAIGVLLVILWMKTRRGAMVFHAWAWALSPPWSYAFRSFCAWMKSAGRWASAPSFGVWHGRVSNSGRYWAGRLAVCAHRQRNGAAGETHAHNLLLELVLSSGVLGVTLLALYLYGNIRDVLRNRRTEGKNGLFNACTGAVLHDARSRHI